MRSAHIAIAGLLVTGAYLAATGQRQQASTATAVADVTDNITETITAYTGIEIMQSSRYAAALANPSNAGIIAVLTAAEDRNGLPAGLLVRQAWQESRFKPNAVNAVSGAQGLMQFMPATAREWGVDPFDPQSAADGAGRYMSWLYDKTSSWTLALAAYNWGIGNVLRKGISAAPTETQNYVAQIGNDLGWV